jgi:hypothetical protein
LFYEFASAITQALLDALVHAIATYVAANWFGQLPPDYVGTEVYAKDLTAGSGLQSSDGAIFGIAGTASGTPLPNNDTIAVARKSGLAGRSFNGRIYWPGLTDAQRTGVNALSTGTANAIRTLLINTDLAAVALEWTPVIVSLFADHAHRAAGVTTPITQWIFADLTLDSRRRRLPGRGH